MIPCCVIDPVIGKFENLVNLGNDHENHQRRHLLLG